MHGKVKKERDGGGKKQSEKLWSGGVGGGGGRVGCEMGRMGKGHDAITSVEL